MIYLDHAASTFPYVEVIHLYANGSSAHFANPAAAHRLGLSEELRIKAAKKNFAGLLHCEPAELIVTSGATESANTAIKGYLNANRHSGTRVLVTAGEHPAVHESARFTCEKLGLEFLEIPLCTNGKLDFEVFAELLNKDVALVCVMAVNNETGAINDLSKVSKLMKQKSPQARLCVDYVQALTKMEINLQRSAVDFGIFSGHKIHAPKGVGLLYLKKGLRIEPLLHGGGHQLGLRSGTENSPLLDAMALAVQLGLEKMPEATEQVKMLRETFLGELDTSLFINNSPEDASPWIINLSFPGIRGETLLHALADREIYLSQASSCHSKAPYSDVLQAMKLPVKRMESAIRVSFDASQNKAEIITAAQIINKVVTTLKH